MNRLWYRQPAKEWEEALPIGNGRMGAMIFGDITNERIQLNEESMWYGSRMNRLNPDMKSNLPQIRRLLREGQVRRAEELMSVAMAGCPNSMHPYQTLGDLYINFEKIEQLERYERALDLDKAVATVSFSDGETIWHREIMASKPADCVVMKLWTEGPGKINFTARLDRSRYLDGVGRIGDDAIRLHGNLGRGGAEFQTLLTARSVGGRVRTVGESLIVENAEAVCLYLRGDTTYQYDAEEKEAYVKAYFKKQDLAKVQEQWNAFEQQEYLYQQALQQFLQEKQLACLRKAMDKDYEQLKQEHIADYQSLFGRTILELKVETQDNDVEEAVQLPTDERLRKVSDEGDLLLTKQLFDYGRYLLIACSRQEGLPATLQGLWNKDFLPPWDSKYTININTEMNYWPAECCNLSECHMPLFTLLKKMQLRGRHTAREMYGCRGFVAHHNTDMHGDTAPQDIWIPATFWPMGAAWLCTHIWTHYLYTRDRHFLSEYLPVMAEAALFFVDYLTPEGDYMTTNPSVSPENAYRLPNGETGACCIGATMDHQILRDLFTDCLLAWHELCDREVSCGTESEKNESGQEAVQQLQQRFAEIPDMPEPAEFMAQLEMLLQKLPPTRIDSKGRIMEWMEEYEEVEPGHRHISHLYGLYPSDQITMDGTPELAEAAAETLEGRLAHGGGHTGWSRAWIINHYAKLWDGEKAYKNIVKMLQTSTYPNLFDKHPPFQIDGNFGVCAGIAQMLVQSNGERVVLLPALPKHWQSGRVKGLKIVGGATIDLRWEKGELWEFTITSPGKNTFLVKYKTKTFSICLSAGERYFYSKK